MTSIDPAALLNPRAAAKPPTKTSNHVKDDSAAPSSGSMIERLHQVEKRDSDQRPAKRAKHESREPEDDEDVVLVHRSQPRQELAGSGEITSALKSQDAEAPPTEQIDLTAEMSDEDSEEEDNDGGLVVIKDNATMEVCLGRIENAQVMAHKVPTPKTSTSFQGSQAKYWMAMSCSLYRRPGSNIVIGVKDPTGRDFGNLDPHTAGALSTLMDGSHVTSLRLQPRLDSRKKKPFDYPGQSVSDRYPITINVYAPRKFVNGIGRMLSQRQVWLREPLLVDKAIQICNPHSPKDFTPKNEGRTQTSTGFTASRTLEQVRQDVSRVFDTLQSTNELPEMNPPTAVKTVLLPHQKQAVYFLYKREKLPVVTRSADNRDVVILDDGDDDAAEGFSSISAKQSPSKESGIWQSKTNQKGETKWVNAITGHKARHEPKAVLGGILADVMGLGKTLNVLSLVVGSLGEASQWALQNTSDTETLFAKGTLLVCPLSTIVNWKEQLATHLQEKSLSYCVYQGASRTNQPKELRKYDLVITTYQTVGMEWSKTSRNRPNKPLFDNNWFRIVLDEAHQIRNASSTQSQAACALEGERRWCVTGTPVQNRLEDLATLIRFLRIEPFHVAGVFSRYIIKPLRSGDKDTIPKLRILVDLITLRRLKDKLNLPKRHEQLVRLTMSESERNLYDHFHKDSRLKVNAMAGDKKRLAGKSYAHILKAIGRLRMLCAHGADMLSDDDWEFSKGFDPLNAIDLEDEDDSRPDKTAPQAFEMYRLISDANVANCAKCSDQIEPSGLEDLEEGEDDTFGFLTPCNQLFCKSCIKSWQADMKSRVGPDNRGVCTICDTYIRVTTFELKLRAFAEDSDRQARIHKSKFARNLSRYNGPHTKTRHLLDDLETNRQWTVSHPDERPIKSVVFSEWTSHLDLIELAFNNYKVPYTRLDGTMSIKKRTVALNTFDTDAEVNVILVSLRAGGLGLNLTAASKVYVMEPNYNPAAEQQAIERVHRLGQKRDVQITRYILSDSIEESVVALQDKKKKLAAFSVERGEEALSSKERSEKALEDIKNLLR